MRFLLFLLFVSSVLAEGIVKAGGYFKHSNKDEPIRAGCVRLYDLPDYTGEMVEHCGTTPLDVMNDRVESVRMAPDVNVVINLDEGGDGILSDTLHEDTPVLEEALLNSVSHITIRYEKRPDNGCAWLYDEVGFQGHLVELCGNVDVTQFYKHGFNDLAKSIKIPDGYASTIYEHMVGVKGFEVTYAEDQYKFGKTVRNKISRVNTVKYVGPGPYCLWAFSEENFQGQRTELCQPENLDTSQRVPPAAQTAKSLRIAPKFQVVLRGAGGENVWLYKRDSDSSNNLKRFDGFIANYLISRKEKVDGAPSANPHFLSAVYYE